MDSSSPEEENFYRRGRAETLSSSVQASPARRAQQQQQPQPEYKVVNVKEPPKSYDSSFHCIHTSIEIVVVVSLICATSELVLGTWVLYVLSRTSNHTSSSKYITLGVGMFIAQSVRIFALVTWLKSSKQELTKAYSATTLCTVVSILVLLPMGCLVLFVALVVFQFVVFTTRPQLEVLEAFMLVAGFDLVFSTIYGSIVACCFQNRLQKRQIYLLRNANDRRTASQIQLDSPAPNRTRRRGNAREPLLPPRAAAHHHDHESCRDFMPLPPQEQIGQAQQANVIHTYPSFQTHHEYFYPNLHYQNNALVAYV